MVRVSRRKVQDNVFDRMFWLFFETIGSKKNRKDFESVIKEVLTPAERLTVAKRIALMYLLIKGIPKDVIYETLKVSRTTISVYALLLDHNQVLSETLQRLAKKDKIKEVIVDFIAEFSAPGIYGTNWSSAWKRKHLREEKKRRGI